MDDHIMIPQWTTEEDIDEWPAIEVRSQLRLLEAFFHKTLDDINAVEAQYGPGRGNPLGCERAAGLPPVGSISVEGRLMVARVLGYASTLMLSEAAAELAESRNAGDQEA